MKNKTAFTLAEVLVTLAVIGIVASLTIPSLIKNYQEQQWKTAWKKTYSDLNQAYNMIISDHNGSLIEYYGTTNMQAGPLVEEFANKLTTIKVCLPIPADSWQYPNLCNTSLALGSVVNYNTMDGANVLAYSNIYHGQIILKNGTHLFFRIYNSEASLIWADVNGYNKGPNTLGKDMFGVMINKNWMKPMGAEGTGPTIDTCTTTPKECSYGYGFHTTSCAGAGCSAWGLQNTDY